MKDFKSLDVSKVFFTSDTHFNHKNIITYCSRPFDTVESMNEAIIANWNNTVPIDGTVFHCGDFAFGGSEAWNKVLPRLNGQIHLILGNHDLKNFRQGYAARFLSVQEQLTIDLGKKKIILTHFPLLCYHGAWGTEANCWNLHGHVHVCKNKQANTGKDFERMKLTFPTQYDVGVDLNDYTPISFEEVKRRIDYQVEHNTNELHWING